MFVFLRQMKKEKTTGPVLMDKIKANENNTANNTSDDSSVDREDARHRSNSSDGSTLCHYNRNSLPTSDPTESLSTSHYTPKNPFLWATSRFLYHDFDYYHFSTIFFFFFWHHLLIYRLICCIQKMKLFLYTMCSQEGSKQHNLLFPGIARGISSLLWV